MLNIAEDTSRHYTVYIHRNKNDGKRYIGITGNPVNKRWENGRGYLTCSYFFRAIIKYGWDNFEHIIYTDNLTKFEAEQMEIELIKKYKTSDSKYGYNLTTGGLENKPNPKTILHMARARPVRKSKYDMLRSVICIDTAIIYKSIRAASADANVPAARICACCDGKAKKTNKQRWMYYDEFIRLDLRPKTILNGIRLCVMCGKEISTTANRQKYCKDCKKSVIRKQKAMWAKEHYGK